MTVNQNDRPKVENLGLDRIRTDGGRGSVNDEVVAEYADLYRQDEILPPVTVFFDGATYWLADGFHRYWATRKIGRDVIAAEIRPGTQRDAILHSVGANAAHGLRRTNADKRKAVLTLLEDEQWSTWSDREIARRCGVGHELVGRQRAILDESTSMESGDRARTFVHPKTGKPTRMKTAKIGRSKRSPASRARKSHTVKGKLTRQASQPVPEEAAHHMVEMYGEEFMHRLVAELGQKGIGSTSSDAPQFRPNPDDAECSDLDVCTDRASAAMGEIDLAVQPRADGKEFQDVLSRAWSGRVWMLPPCIEPWIDRFCRKLIEHAEAGDVTEAVVLVRSRTEAPWFQTLLSAASAVCLVAGFIRFQNRNKTSVPPHGYAAVYLGKNPDRFFSEFKTVGCVCSCTFPEPDGSQSRAKDMEVTR
ncbi:MAG: hypothetical protein GXP25_00595 [Planctomycetes bacterium]|nr:hypothetical protein [Planctomycetota bacterium]